MFQCHTLYWWNVHGNDCSAHRLSRLRAGTEFATKLLCDNDQLNFRGLLMNRCALILLLSITTVAQNSPAPSAAPFDGKSWWNYVKVLADDNMEGRETGSEGLRRAAAYIVEQLKNDGLEPAGSNGYYQPVKLISRQIDESGSSLALVRNGATEPLTLGDDAMFSTRVDLAPEVDAPLVFVGLRPATFPRKSTTISPDSI